MNIKISKANEPRIVAALANVNGRATAHTATCEDLFSAAEQAEQKLAALGLTKAQRRLRDSEGGGVVTCLDIDALKIKATAIPRAGNLVAVDACTADGRRLSVVWERDGTGHVVVDELEHDESDVVWTAVELQMLESKLWS